MLFYFQEIVNFRMKKLSVITRFRTIKLSDTNYPNAFDSNIAVLQRSVEIPKHAFLAHMGTVGLQNAAVLVSQAKVISFSLSFQAGLDKSILQQFIQLRADYKTAKLAKSVI